VTVSPRDKLHLYVDALPEEDLPIAERLLAGLAATAGPVARALALAPDDDEPDDDDRDGGISEVAEESARGEWISHSDLKRRLDIE
jgi:hypothetical protein